MITYHLPNDWVITEDSNGGIAITDNNGARRCGAKRKNEQPCKSRPVKGRNRCRVHGGQVPRGKLNPSYKDGKFSRYAPASLRQRMALLADTDATDLTENALLLDARLGQLIGSVNGGEYGAKSSDLLALWNKGVSQLQDRDLESFLDTYNQMGDTVKAVQGDYSIWENVLTITKERRGIARDIHHITKGADGMMTAVEVLEIVLKMADLFLSINALQTERERTAQWRVGVDRIISLPGA